MLAEKMEEEKAKAKEVPLAVVPTTRFDILLCTQLTQTCNSKKRFAHTNPQVQEKHIGAKLLKMLPPVTGRGRERGRS